MTARASRSFAWPTMPVGRQKKGRATCPPPKIRLCAGLTLPYLLFFLLCFTMTMEDPSASLPEPSVTL